MFAFAILDARTRADPSSPATASAMKPLYWTSGAAGFAFASELSALLACPIVERRGRSAAPSPATSASTTCRRRSDGARRLEALEPGQS